MKVLIACVNYNTNDKLKSYLKSVEKAVEKYNGELDLFFLIGDNSDVVEKIDTDLKRDITLLHLDSNGNHGYIGGITLAIEKSNLKIKDFDFVIVSNVDLKLSENFFDELLKEKNYINTGWIAPLIYSEKEERDRNPKINSRPSNFKMKLLIVLFRFPLLHRIYEKLIYHNRSKGLQESNRDGNIYAGHGSFMIFTKAFLKDLKKIEFPGFLFGEEIYFGELIHKRGLKTKYCPSIEVYDFDHASTSKMKSKIYYKMNYESLKLLTKMFFNE